jgi:hypothetical protein
MRTVSGEFSFASAIPPIVHFVFHLRNNIVAPIRIRASGQYDAIDLQTSLLYQYPRWVNISAAPSPRKIIDGMSRCQSFTLKTNNMKKAIPTMMIKAGKYIENEP